MFFSTPHIVYNPQQSSYKLAFFMCLSALATQCWLALHSLALIFSTPAPCCRGSYQLFVIYEPEGPKMSEDGGAYP